MHGESRGEVLCRRLEVSLIQAPRALHPVFCKLSKKLVRSEFGDIDIKRKHSPSGTLRLAIGEIAQAVHTVLPSLKEIECSLTSRSSTALVRVFDSEPSSSDVCKRSQSAA